jgi:hypothetical protein
MKEAYVSVVLPMKSAMPRQELLHDLDRRLKRMTRNHEIVVVAPFSSQSSEFGKEFQLSGPISFVYTNNNANKNMALIAGLSRAVGDFVIEWKGNIESLNEQELSELLEPTNRGFEIIELEFVENPLSSRVFYKIVNALRSSKIPVRKTIARAYSRRALGLVLNGSNFEPLIDVLFAELALQRIVRKSKLTLSNKESLRERIVEGVTLLAKGSRFGTVVPLILAAFSGLFVVGVSAYAIFLYFTVGKNPEGWTTLMVVTGLGQASILGLLGLTWSKIDSFMRGFSRQTDATAEVVVIAPRI